MQIKGNVRNCCWFRNPANQWRLVVDPIIYRVLYIPGGAGFLPSTVSTPVYFFARDKNGQAIRSLDVLQVEKTQNG